MWRNIEMSTYKEFESVRLKDGRIATIVEVLGNGQYIGDVGYSPKNWDTIDIVESNIERVATEEEIKRESEESQRQLKEMGLWEKKA